MEKKSEVIVEEKEVASPQTSNLEKLLESGSIVSEAQLSTRFETSVYKGNNGKYDAEFGEQYGESDRLLEIIIGYNRGDFRWSGKVIHDNIDAFFQALERELEVLDDLDNDEAIVKVLKEAMVTLEKPNLILNVEGGVVNEAVTSLPVSLIILDGDTEGLESDEIKVIEGEECFVNSVIVEDNVERVTELVGEIKASK